MVDTLWARLVTEGYLAAVSAPDKRKGKSVFGPRLGRALKQYQSDHALRQTARMNGATLRALNVTTAARLAMFRRALVKISRAVGPVVSDLILVHLPGATAEVYLGGKLWRNLRVVIGSARKRRNLKTHRRDFAFKLPSCRRVSSGSS